MEPKFTHFDLRIVEPTFGSTLTDTIIELERLRAPCRIRSRVHPAIFSQLKSIFHTLESLGSVRIEGNNTTLSDIIEKTIDGTIKTSKEEQIKAFKELKQVTIPELAPECTSSWAQYTLQLSSRDAFQKKLQENGVPTAVHYPRTMPDQPAYTELGRTLNIEVSRRLAETVVSLPLYPDMTDDIQDYVIEQVLKAF